MDYYLDSELIILEVEKNPCIYDFQHDDYKNREVKKDAWTSVSKNVVGEEWTQMDNATRSDIEKEVQGKWKNLKDRFLKSVKEGGNGSDGRRTKRPYIYHKQMQFLLTVYNRRENSEDMNEDKSMDVNDASEAPTVKADEPAIVAGPFLRKLLNRKSNPSEKDDLKIASEAPIARVNEPAIVAGPSSRNLKRRKPDPFERDDLKIQQANERQDADEMFLLSQLPHIKKMRTNNKLEFQVKFLQLIQQYSNECESAYVPTPSFKNSVWSSSSNASATPPHKEFDKDNDSVLSF